MKDVEPTMTGNLDVKSQVQALIEKGKQRGYLTYEEMNDELPDEAVSPDKLDELLITLDDLDIELIDEADIEKRTSGTESTPAAAAEQADPHEADDLLLERDLAEASNRRIDDPVGCT